MPKKLSKTKPALNEEELKKRFLAWYNNSNERSEARSLKKNDTIKIKKTSEKNKFPSTKTGLKKIKDKIRKDNHRKRMEKMNSYNEDTLQDTEGIKRDNIEQNLRYFTFNPKEIDKELDE
ncbi:22475_t:CDS:2 [Dentiscutata erythropus]|uniref:22475_t:CDS:1 n=1 Tax=Dentiscutata erythropus TaxID=1348616 RepID=A0A9N9DMM9_9GLOM|nr:22475_t:CDS:2 [Dentiscutata erythropus]